MKEKIEIFNTQIIIIDNHIINISDDEKMILADNAKSFLIIIDYIKAVDNNFYNEVDSVLCILISVWLYVFFSFYSVSLTSHVSILQADSEQSAEETEYETQYIYLSDYLFIVSSWD